MKYFFVIVGVLISFQSFAGQIRSVSVSAKNMQNIYLKLGQSTVLRFTETPKKVVVGNQNYFNIEFIGNDITIQPQGIVKTNLFVYGEYHTFGFILNVGAGSSYDDLVNVSWKSPIVTSRPREKLAESKINKTMKLKDGIKCEVESLKELKKNFFVIDFNLVNNGKEKIKSKNLDLFLSRSKIKLPKQRLVLAGETIGKDFGIKGRLFFELEKREAFSLHCKSSNEKSKTIISDSYLR